MGLSDVALRSQTNWKDGSGHVADGVSVDVEMGAM
jgi:hypothetical protein